MHKQFVLVRREDDVVYLTRWWLVKTPWCGIILHRMDGPDARATLHDHPFAFTSIVLRGGYIERRLDPMQMKTIDHVVRRMNVMRRDDAHSIRTLLRVPTWTLMLVGRHRRTWGFLYTYEDLPDAGPDITDIGWVRHDQFDSGHRLDDERSPIKYG